VNQPSKGPRIPSLKKKEVEEMTNSDEEDDESNEDGEETIFIKEFFVLLLNWSK
jgi:hypothetical protein